MLRKLLFYLALSTFLIAGCVDSESGSSCMRQSLQGGGGSTGKLRHVVLVQFKDGISGEQIKALENAFRALPHGIDQVFNFEWGTDVSVENLAEGFTHCFMFTFESEENRDRYLKHPAHKAFAAMLEQHVEKVLVVDYVAQK